MTLYVAQAPKVRKVRRVTLPGAGWPFPRYMSADGQCAQIAALQHGAISRAQAHRCGLSDAGIRWRVGEGRLREARPDTFTIAGTPGGWWQDLWTAYLWAGQPAALSHRSAGALWELEGVNRGTLELTTPRRLATAGVVVHRKRLLEVDTRRLGGLRVTAAGRTLLDLADVIHAARVERALDDALHRGLVTLSGLRALIERAGGRGVRGTTLLRDLLDSRHRDDAVSETTLERRLGRLLRRAGTARPKPQYEVFDKNGLVARVDFAYPDCRLAVEADGYRYHSGRQAWRSDLSRRSRLAQAGWRVLHFTWDEVHDDPEAVIDQVRGSLERGRPIATS